MKFFGLFKRSAAVLAVLFCILSVNAQPLRDMEAYEQVISTFRKELYNGNLPAARGLTDLVSNKSDVEFNGSQVLVATLLSSNDYHKYYKQNTRSGVAYTVSPDHLVWVFMPREVSKRATGKSHDRLIKLFGLPYDARKDTVLFMYVDKNKLFRPAYSTDVNSLVTATAFPPGDPNYTWLLKQSINNTAPWTRKGYTYDWDPSSPDHIGITEFVLRGGTSFVPLGYMPTVDFLLTAPATFINANIGGMVQQ